MSTVGEYFDSTNLRGIDEGLGSSGVVQSLHGTPRSGELELMTGVPGDRGPVGESARPFRWEGDIADQAALSAMSTKLGAAQAGKAWRVVSSDTLVYWNGTGFDTFADAFGAAGPDGSPCVVSLGSVDTGEVGAPLQATIVGTPPNLVLHLTVPRGVRGREGEIGGPGPIRQAADYADGPHPDGSVPTWNGTAGKWEPRPFPGLRGPWSISETQAWDGSAGFGASQTNVGTSPNVIAQLAIPAQDSAWRPVVSGGVMLRTTSTDASTRIDAEVRIGSADGQIVALGSGFVMAMDSFCDFQPFFAASSMTPGSAVGVVPAGQPVSLYVVLRRNRGGANYTYTRSGAQIMCWARPVTTL